MSKAEAILIYQAAVRACLPDRIVRDALHTCPLTERVALFAIGKAAHRMASAAVSVLGERVKSGLVVSKYGHIPGPIAGLDCIEAGHPLPDENSVDAAQHVLAMAAQLRRGDTALVLLSGGGSALFELPAPGVTLEEMARITAHLLHCGAQIDEINCIRKHLSQVKGGRLAAALTPARIVTAALSDVLSDAPDVIASGPTCADASTSAQACAIAQRYGLMLSAAAQAALEKETPKSVPGEMLVSGSVRHLCEAARAAAEQLGYTARVVDTSLTGEARLEGASLSALSAELPARTALIFGGETVVHVLGGGKGGRCQELVLGGAQTLAPGVVLLAAGSDGTDGPTDAAGAVIDSTFGASAGRTAILRALEENNAYPLLKQHGALIAGGATGTNVNDLYLLLKDG